MGGDYGDFERGEDVIVRYVAGVKQLPQLTPPGEVFAYKRRRGRARRPSDRDVDGQAVRDAAAGAGAGVVGARPLRHSGFFTDQLVGESKAASHDAKEDRAVVMSRFRAASTRPAA